MITSEKGFLAEKSSSSHQKDSTLLRMTMSLSATWLFTVRQAEKHILTGVLVNALPFETAV